MFSMAVDFLITCFKVALLSFNGVFSIHGLCQMLGFEDDFVFLLSQKRERPTKFHALNNLPDFRTLVSFENTEKYEVPFERLDDLKRKQSAQISSLSTTWRLYSLRR
jgi:hypothetical protein